MSKFKVGDRVRRIRCDNGDDMQVGRTGTIRRVQADGDVMVDVDGGSDACFCMAEYLELVPVAEATGTATDGAQADKPKFKVGDRVRIASGPNNGGFGQIGDTGVIETVGRTDCLVRFETGGRSGEAWYVGFDYLEPVAVAPQPQPPAKEPLRIQPGKFYRTRDGLKVGPARQNWGDSDYPWWVGESTYTDSGAWLTGGYVDDNDLVAEADEPPVAEQRAGTPSSTAGFTVPLEAYGGELENEVDATLTTKITVDFSDFDAELDRIFGRLRKLKRKARKMGISLDAGGLQDAA